MLLAFQGHFDTSIGQASALSIVLAHAPIFELDFRPYTRFKTPKSIHVTRYTDGAANIRAPADERALKSQESCLTARRASRSKI